MPSIFAILIAIFYTVRFFNRRRERENADFLKQYMANLERERQIAARDYAYIKQRVDALKERSKTQFLAEPGDPRLKPDWEYMLALKKADEDTFTFTFFTAKGIHETQTNMSEQAIGELMKQGWYLNAQGFHGEERSYQLERPLPSSTS